MADIVIFILKGILSAAISVLLTAMFLRTLISLFVGPMEEGKLSSFLFTLTEPVIYPIRALCAKLHWFEGTPMDMPFMLTFLLLTLLDLLISIL